MNGTGNSFTDWIQPFVNSIQPNIDQAAAAAATAAAAQAQSKPIGLTIDPATQTWITLLVVGALVVFVVLKN